MVHFKDICLHYKNSAYRFDDLQEYRSFVLEDLSEVGKAFMLLDFKYEDINDKILEERLDFRVGSLQGIMTIYGTVTNVLQAFSEERVKRLFASPYKYVSILIGPDFKTEKCVVVIGKQRICVVEDGEATWKVK